jgi:hypothetical protein
VPLLNLGASTSDLEEPDHRGQFVIDGELLLHFEDGDGHGEREDDLLVGDLWNPIADLAEALDECVESLAKALAHHLEVVLCGGMLVGGHEVGDELLAEVLSRGDGLRGEVNQPHASLFLEGHGKQVGHDMMFTARSLDAHGVELQEFKRVGAAIVT